MRDALNEVYLSVEIPKLIQKSPPSFTSARKFHFRSVVNIYLEIFRFHWTMLFIYMCIILRQLQTASAYFRCDDRCHVNLRGKTAPAYLCSKSFGDDGVSKCFKKNLSWRGTWKGRDYVFCVVHTIFFKECAMQNFCWTIKCCKASSYPLIEPFTYLNCFIRPQQNIQ